MATSSFILKEPGSSKPTLIFFVIRGVVGDDGKYCRLKYSTGERVLPSRWDRKEYRAGMNESGTFKPTRLEKITNTQLGRYKELFEIMLSDAKLNKKSIELNVARELLDTEFKEVVRSSTQDITSLVDFTTKHIEVCDKKLETRKGYGTTLNKLKAFQKDKNTVLRFEDITMDFYYSFIDWLKEKNYATNTIGGHIKNVKVFMEAALYLKLHENEAYRSKGFKVVDEKTESIYLTEEDIETLYTLDLSKHKKLDRIRDLFIVGCRTGLRFSDLTKLTPDKIINNGTMFKIRTQKTGEVVFIPLHWQTREILQKYEYELPVKISNQKFNDYLKELGEKAELDSEVTIYRTQGNDNKAITKPKSKFISVHTARRTFATLAYKAGMPALSIMKITGHRSEKSFIKYVKLSNEEHAQIMAKHEFFSPLKKVD